MTCAEVSELLSPYLDRRVAAPEADEVAVHLEACARCRGELAELRFSAALLASLPAPPLGDDLAAAVVARASTPRWHERWAALQDWVAPRRSFLAWQLSRAIAIVALFLLAATARGRGPSDLVISWPGRVAGAAGAGMAQVTAGIAEAQAYLASGRTALPARPAARRSRERRVAPLRPSSIPSRPAIAANRQEVTHHDLA